MRPIACLSACFVGLGIGPRGPLLAQQATLVGVVVDSATGAPLPGADVIVLEQDVRTATDGRGRFVLRGVVDGLFTLFLRSAGYTAGLLQAEIVVVQEVEVDLGTIQLSPLVTELDSVTVEGKIFDSKLSKVGFYHRMHAEKGTFLTREDIELYHPSLTSDVIRRIPGFRVLNNGSVSSTRGVPSVSTGFELCDVQYYIDGVHASAPNIDVVIPAAISGIEVYTGSSTIPQLFRGKGNAKCGVVAIWLRAR
ncbi:MAG: carboxypeptidase regulatory-like domain-containing protein [Gemmatimonadales bacterium]